MKYKLSIGILVMFVSMIMLMSNALASGWPPVWAFQATLSTVNGLQSQDPENSGFGTIQVVVWEEWNGVDWDIYLKYHLTDGNPVVGWTFPPAHPATTGMDEINPAVTVTNASPVTGLTEVHVVYQCWNPVGGGQWDICHTYATIPAFFWSFPFVLDTPPAGAHDAIDPAIVYTEDVSNPGIGLGWLVQFTWAQFNPATALYDIMYDAHYYDPTLVPTRGYVSALLVPAGPVVVRGILWGSCEKPEIASVDELWTVGSFDYYFAIVWQEPRLGAPATIDVWYRDGTTQTSGPGGVFVAFAGGAGQLNPVVAGNSYDPDIAATQDYQSNETYYFHVNWVYDSVVAPRFWRIDTCYAWGAVPTPGAAAFAATAPARGPIIGNIMDRPTIASKLNQTGPTIFETWMCWEDYSLPAGPNIWYRVGVLNTAALPPLFVYILTPAAPVPYVPRGGLSSNFNPELWNRNDGTRMFPPLTHLVFDQGIPAGAVPEVIYIDP